MKGVFVLLLFLCSSIPLHAQHIVCDAWEPGEERIPFQPSVSTVQEPQGLLLTWFDRAIEYYQKKISPRSVSRCPFSVSCSHFASRVIHRHGLYGIALFVDRYFYRENGEAYAHYPLVETSRRTLKLDDSFFLDE